eukprot:CAMPEP_0117027738 /NCGR_PEP_ID=MMETSP0472-20121206/20241_1 /TAXON_ID=693140 ORGANISM="Tiarina fusus, Strain LIS" /NCGR_SAMPLE_ID=MMETSP0472 /ASSEMBLY_ACC=CAM_ASM_000603 /LENGTH=1076 /DNA_ID=CAMNT_0004735053 /DNA_START=69 /DNA_END=3299 /DNA_ORIENTATION=-
MPLTRQSSNSSLGSLNLPVSIKSSTHVTKEKAQKAMKSRRSTRGKSMAEKKQKEKGILQSPTPYWKVAMERGMSPPETRSTKKKKRGTRLAFSPEDKENDSCEAKPALKSGLLVFSPPDQAENERREKEEIERKEKSRNSRVQKARTSGQLLVFSPTLRNPAPLPPGTPDEKETAHSPRPGKRSKTNSEKSDNESKQQEKKAIKDSESPTNMEVDIEGDQDKSQVSATSTQSFVNNSDHITNELKSLRETISRLVESKETTATCSLDVEQEKRSLEAQLMTQTLSAQNSKLERRIERFEVEFKALESNSSAERERLVVENTRLQSQLEASTRETDEKIRNLEEMKVKLEYQCADMGTEKSRLFDQTVVLEKELADVRFSLSAEKTALAELKSQKSEETDMISKELNHLKQTNSDLCAEIAETNARNEQLASVIGEYEKQIDILENTLLPESEAQLQEARDELNRFKMEDSKHSSQTEVYAQAIDELKQELVIIRKEKEEERENFQALNQDSSDAFMQMTKDLEARNVATKNLQTRIEELENSLDQATETLTTANGEMENLKSSTGSRIKELEDSLQSVRSDLKQVGSEKGDFEQKLNDALVEIRKHDKRKEEFVAQIEETSAEIESMQNQTDSMQRRIKDLEQQLDMAKRERDDARLRLETSDDREEDLFTKLRESHLIRRELHNRVMQLSGNIRVYVRVRPTLPEEQKAPLEISTQAQRPGGKKRKHVEVEPEELFKFPGMCSSDGKKSTLGADDPTKNLLELTEPKKDRGGLSERQKKWKFGFDHVFNQSHQQSDVWEATEPLIQSAVDGFNVTLFAYGQTGSGKTFTMLGERGNEGIIERAVRKLFDSKAEVEQVSRGDSKVELSVELLEVYNEQIRDLLVPNAGSEGRELSLKVSANEAVGNIHQPVSSEEEVSKILRLAQKRRCVKATASNAVSSRSHMLFTIHFKVESKSGVSRSGRLNVCDLAGSERLSKSEANTYVGSSLLKETKHINTSLSVLSNVIEKLQSGDSNVPYRESKLTYLLQNSLGGNSKTLAIICCSPLQLHFHETLCSLRFAAKVNRVDLKAKANFSC